MSRYCQLIGACVGKRRSPSRIDNANDVMGVDIRCDSVSLILFYNLLFFSNRCYIHRSILFRRVPDLPHGSPIRYTNANHPLMFGVTNVIKKREFKARSVSVQEEEWGNAISSITNTILIKGPENVSKNWGCYGSILTPITITWDFFPIKDAGRSAGKHFAFSCVVFHEIFV